MSEDKTHESAKLEDLYLSDFQRNNPQCKFSMDEGKFVIERPWSVDDIRFVFDPNEIEVLRDINNIAFRPAFDAIFHVDLNEVEFIFAYLKPDDESARSYVDRSFTFNFLGNKLDCCFKEPSSRLFELAKRIRWLPSIPSIGGAIARQLRAFRDAQRLDSLPEMAKEYFAERVPRSFIVKTEKPLLDCDWEQLSRHINFHMRYYDRKTPIIEVRYEDKSKEVEAVSERRFLADSFPTAMAAHEIDDFMLQLMEIAAMTSPRFAFIYYYQVIEYAGFYFVDEKSKRQIRQFLTDPSMVMCPEDKVSELLTVLSDLQRSDDVKICRVIEDYCDPCIVWQEVENDRVFFSSPVEFEGGYQLPALIAGDMSVDTWQAMWMPKTIHQH
ncbi:MAG: hypothetical protein PVJ86_02950 [Phycisphaerales bacterium]|jgi:hypothetical protein